MSFRTIPRTWAAIMVVLLALAACASPVAEEDLTQQEADDAADQEANGEDDDGPVRIVYWSMFSTGEPLQRVLEAATEEFMAENPDIEVEINWAGRDNLTQLRAALSAGQQVDIVDHSDDRVRNAVVVNDLAMRLDDYLQEPPYGAEEGTWLDTFHPGTVEAFAEEDGSYMIPREVYVSGMWYNVPLFEEAGITPAVTGMTWDEFLDILEGLEQDYPDVSPLGADGTVDFYNNWWFTYLAIRLAGVEAFRAAAYDESGESWRQPEFLQAAEMFRDLQDRGYFQSGFDGSVWPAAQVEFVNGNIAMMFMGAWLPQEMEDQQPEEFAMDMFAFPNVEGGAGNDVIEFWSNAFAVLEDTEHPDAAVSWLKYVTSSEHGGSGIMDLGYPMPWTDAPIPETHAGQFEALEEYETTPARAGLNEEIPDYMTEVFNACNDPFFQLQTTPQEFIDCLATQSASFWQ